ncbi:MAG TPA: hypothetical protein VGQ72_10575 [Pyrinomonadaceae bacterium]|jgi:hypothetical protein|nr:hypothetical protein [Pyrinomonadaceae bacterium]
MKNIRGFTLGLVLGVGIALSGLAFAQNTNDQNKKADSCCAMAACCCKGDSCPMKDSKDKSDKHECCCCGDSCEMKDMKDMKMKDMKDMKNKP